MKTFLTYSTSILLSIAALVASAPTSATEESSNNSTVPNLEARSNEIVGEHYCGVFANADSNNAKSLVQSLGSDKTNNKYSIGAHGCYRVACHNTSGVYVCNDNDFELIVNGKDVANAADYITRHCCYAADVAGRGSYSIRSGQQFTQWGWNVAVGYADCKAGATQRPSDAGGWGVNPGTCPAQQGMTNANSDY
ncbi:hypothetical protein VMCG_06924 [Cytospora schulzeri]|uniref:Ecp2 effector protein domain-containing protein n=1 Tax=Cytospora schulzeri TaxID=448051 RepID=A0A423W257_9PEZI|nr:hypothetical protein VMCG_06924 [Valsa malicola]